MIRSSSILRAAVILAVVAATPLIPCLRALANPSSKDPARPLACHGTIDGACELVNSLYGVYDEEAKFVDQTYARKDDPSSFSDRKIASAAGRLWKARRDAKRLQIMGEPAGYDLYRKLQLLATEVYKFGQAYRGTPQGNQLARRILGKLQREKPQMQKFLQQAENALQQGRLEIFEREMEKRGEELSEQLVFFSSAESQPFDGAFYALLARGDSALETNRKTEYTSQASLRIDRERSAVDQFADEASRVAQEVARSGSAKLEEETGGGPMEAFLYVGSRWGAASASLLRADGIQWAFPGAQPSKSADQRGLKEIALRSLAAIVEAASKSTPPSEVARVYGGMLEAVSVIERRNGIINTDVSRACAAALETLASKDPSLTERIAAYERATKEVLRWRQSYAAEQAAHLGRNAPRGSAALTIQCSPDGSVRPPYARRPLPDSPAASGLFTQPAQWLVQETSTCLVGTSVIEDRLVRLSPTSRVAVAPLSDSHYANLPVPVPCDAEVASLRAALLVDQDHVPLTLAAADAVSAATMQDYETVMGKIETIHLESIVTRMISLPDQAYPIVNLGNPPVINPNVSAVEQTCWRLDLRPLWVRNRYFTVRLEAAQSP